ncbi:MAG: AI-2E family transporter, partial [Alphaproteobacteria bacterium]|nr:AI-2E family transporter [Alphaproteobacteria bacterium]
MTAGRQAAYWLAALAILLTLVWLLSSILLPFVAGMAVAYFLDPPTDKLEARGLSRSLSTTIIVVVFFILMVLAGLLLVPILHAQFSGFAERLPGYISGLRETTLP